MRLNNVKQLAASVVTFSSLSRVLTNITFADNEGDGAGVQQVRRARQPQQQVLGLSARIQPAGVRQGQCSVPILTSFIFCFSSGARCRVRRAAEPAPTWRRCSGGRANAPNARPNARPTSVGTLTPRSGTRSESSLGRFQSCREPWVNPVFSMSNYINMAKFMRYFRIWSLFVLISAMMALIIE